MFCVALTGGIGSGKSTVANYFKKLGVEIIDADEIAHRITEPYTYSFETIVEHFGKDILQPDGNLNRKILRDIIFNNEKERVWLEKLLHPIIREAMKLHVAQSNSVYCLLLIPLIFDKSKYQYINRICVITSPENLRIQRIIERDHTNPAQVKAIIESQVPIEDLLSMADDVIQNDGDLEKLKRDAFQLHQKYLEMAKEYK